MRIPKVRGIQGRDNVKYLAAQNQLEGFLSDWHENKRCGDVCGNGWIMVQCRDGNACLSQHIRDDAIVWADLQNGLRFKFKNLFS